MGKLSLHWLFGRNKMFELTIEIKELTNQKIGGCMHFEHLH